MYADDNMMLVQVGFFEPVYASQATRTLGVGTGVAGVRMCCCSAAVCVMGGLVWWWCVEGSGG